METQDVARPDDQKYDPIAIVGFALRFPGGATSAQSFWDILMHEKCVSQEFPEDRIALSGIHHPDPTRHDSVSKPLISLNHQT